MNGPGIMHTPRYKAARLAGVTDEQFWAAREREAEQRLAAAGYDLAELGSAVREGAYPVTSADSARVSAGGVW